MLSRGPRGVVISNVGGGVLRVGVGVCVISGLGSDSVCGSFAQDSWKGELAALRRSTFGIVIQPVSAEETTFLRIQDSTTLLFALIHHLVKTIES